MLEEVTKRRILKAEEREENAPNAGEKILEDEHFFFFFFLRLKMNISYLLFIAINFGTINMSISSLQTRGGNAFQLPNKCTSIQVC